MNSLLLLQLHSCFYNSRKIFPESGNWLICIQGFAILEKKRTRYLAIWGMLFSKKRVLSREYCNLACVTGGFVGDWNNGKNRK